MRRSSGTRLIYRASNSRKAKKTQDAVIRNLEVIGAAAKSVSAPMRRENPHIPWKDLAGVRDKLIHHYFGINFAIVWKIIRDDLPPLLPQIDEMLHEIDVATLEDEDGGVSVV